MDFPSLCRLARRCRRGAPKYRDEMTGMLSRAGQGRAAIA